MGTSYLTACVRELALFSMVCIFAAPLLAQEAPQISVNQLLKQSLFALQNTHYLGAFTYEFGGAIESVAFEHHTKQGVQHKVIKNLNGEARIFERREPAATCLSLGSILFGGGSVTTRGGVLSLSDSYRLSLVGRDRIANRPAWVMEAVPLDRFRYGVSLTLDEQTGLPLRVMMMNGANATIERLQFISLNIADEIPQTEVSEVNTNLSQHKAPQSPSCADKNRQQTVTKPTVIPRWLPRGFVLAQHDIDAEQRSVATYTDGIASFTLSSSPASASRPMRKGLARRGATLALLSTMSDPAEQLAWQIALVGEIPALTAKQIMASLTL